MKAERSWGWPVGGYLYLGGLGGGAIVVASVADLLLDRGDMFALGAFAGVMAIGLGCALLVFELGQPLRFWRVLSAQKAVMTVGAWLLAWLAVLGFVYCTFWLNFLPWSSLTGIRKVIAGLNLLLGLGVCTYTGVLLGSMKPRRFWNTPALPVLFLLSGLSTGLALQSLMAGLWPYQGDHAAVAATHGLLTTVDLGLIGLELLTLLVYVVMMRTSLGDTASRAAARLLTGSWALYFWGGVVVLGLLLPAVLYVLGVPVVPAVCVLVGGLILRFLVLYSADREYLPGEQRYIARLPNGDELFLGPAHPVP